MCCFSGPVKDVAATRIFARMSALGRQILAYEMQFAAAGEVAMVLPIPTPARSAEDAVRFISLEHYDMLFEDLYEAFAWPGGRPRSASFALSKSATPLKVEEVGAFVASFVPTLADFSRLDRRFRMPEGTLDRVPEYADWGFVVFQLGATRGRTRVHPMAFEFPTREPEQLFFPTLHVHDGALHEEAHFDHVLYAQGLHDHRMFEHSRYRAGHTIHRQRARSVLDLDAKLARRELAGMLPNRDEWARLV